MPLVIFLSVLALFFIQCTVKPSKRSHNNAIGIWVGSSMLENDFNKDGNWILGIDLKHLNSKNIVSGANSALNVYSGYHFGEHPGMNMDVSFNVLTNDLVSKTNGTASQFYIGPSLGLSYLKGDGRLYKYKPKVGATGGILVLIPEYKFFPESDITVEGSMDVRKKTVNEDDMLRVLYHVYAF